MMKKVYSYSKYKQITKELYKKNLELFNVNRELTLLQKLYEITTTSFELTDLAQKFIDVIVKDLGFLFGAVAIRDKKLKSLKVISLTKSKAYRIALKKVGFDLFKHDIPLNNDENLIVSTYKSRKKHTTHSIYDVLRPLATYDVAGKIQEDAGIKSTILFPIAFGDRELGTFMVFVDRHIVDMSQFDKRTLDRISAVFGVAIDRLMLYLDLQKLNFRLKELDEQKDEFISMAAHELRAPMTAIKGYISMIMEGDAGDIPEKARGYLADANNINDRLVRLVNNMLNVSRIEEGRMVYQIEDEYLSQVVRLVYSQFVPEAERKGLVYKLDLKTKIKDKVRVDPDRIQEVIGNLISNAVKYTNSGVIKVKLTQPDKSIVRFEVIDTGPGISEEEQRKLFQKFERIETNLGKTTGTGLGLYISKLLIEKFNGKIGITAKPGKGSTFWFELPLVTSTVS